jgi:hypothetical protein
MPFPIHGDDGRCDCFDSDDPGKIQRSSSGSAEQSSRRVFASTSYRSMERLDLHDLVSECPAPMRAPLTTLSVDTPSPVTVPYQRTCDPHLRLSRWRYFLSLPGRRHRRRRGCCHCFGDSERWWW